MVDLRQLLFKIPWNVGVVVDGGSLVDLVDKVEIFDSNAVYYTF